MSRAAQGNSLARQTGFYSSSTVLGLLFLFPLVWTLFSSLHGREATAGRSPNGFGLDNYRRVFDYGAGIGAYLVNTTTVALLTVILTTVVTTLGGYAFARFDFAGKNVLFLATLAILMVPYSSILIPLYVFLGWIGLQDSLVGLALVFTVFQLPFGLFMMRNSFEAIPIDIEEAALLDGCSPTSALRRVLLRAVTPGIITVALFAFLASWNDFITPLILLTDGSKFTLPVALFNLQSGADNVVDFGALQSGVVIAAVPCVALFLVLQRFYVRGFTSGAVKG